MFGPMVILLVLVGSPSGASAQDLLVRTDQLSRSGRTEQARELLLLWWEREAAGATRSDRQRGIWLRAALTVDPVEAAIDYQRLVVEFPGGAFADRALTRLAQTAEVMEELARAAEYYRRVVHDHPGSSFAAPASRWLEKHAGGLGLEEFSAQPAAEPSAEPAERSPPRLHRAEIQPRRVPTRPLPPRGVPNSGDFTVQVGAFSDAGRAADLLDQLLAEGFEARTTRIFGSELVRVRVGRFEDAGRATYVLDRLRGRGFDAMVLADAARERPVG